MKNRSKPIPKEKVKLVKDLSEQMKSSRTVMLASCVGMPGSQFHKIKKDLRGQAEMKVVRKSAFLRAVESSGKEKMKGLEAKAVDNFVILLSDKDAFTLAEVLLSNRSSRAAKPGDIAPEDVDVEPGPTDLLPGPAISELSGVGLKVAVKDGKLEIQKGATIAKAGESIPANVASVMSKLGIKPIKVGFSPLAAYDSEDDMVYVDIKIDKEGAYDALKEAIRKSLGFAVGIGYPAKETIKFFISKAAMEEKAIEKLLGVEKAEESTTEVSEEAGSEEDKEVSKEEAGENKGEVDASSEEKSKDEEASTEEVEAPVEEKEEETAQEDTQDKTEKEDK